MHDLIAGLIGGLVGGSIAERRNRTRAIQRWNQYRQGKDVSVPTAIRSGDQSGWLHGQLMISNGTVFWTPPAMPNRKTSIKRENSRILQIREVGAAEAMNVNPSARIILYQRSDEVLELAVAKDDLRLVKTVLETPATNSS